VIAIPVTLLVLEIRPPQDTRHLLDDLAALWPSYVSYVITFMLIGQVWANHHVMFDHIRHADRLVLFLNTVLLMDIAFLPFAAAVLANSFRDGQGERIAVVLHGVAFELAAALFNAIWWLFAIMPLYARRRRLVATGGRPMLHVGCTRQRQTVNMALTNTNRRPPRLERGTYRLGGRLALWVNLLLSWSGSVCSSSGYSSMSPVSARFWHVAGTGTALVAHLVTRPLRRCYVVPWPE
jgi:hypothetical protein